MEEEGSRDPRNSKPGKEILYGRTREKIEMHGGMLPERQKC